MAGSHFGLGVDPGVLLPFASRRRLFEALLRRSADPTMTLASAARYSGVDPTTVRIYSSVVSLDDARWVLRVFEHLTPVTHWDGPLVDLLDKLATDSVPALWARLDRHRVILRPRLATRGPRGPGGRGAPWVTLEGGRFPELGMRWTDFASSFGRRVA